MKGGGVWPLAHAAPQDGEWMVDDKLLLEIYRFKSFRISRAALAPEAPVSPEPGCVPDPHK